MKRREFITVLCTAAAWPLAAHAQEVGRIYRLGFLIPVARQAPPVVSFLQELATNGFVEGQNLIVVPGGFEVRNDQISEVAASLVNGAPDAILSGGDLATRALQQMTQTIPIFGMTEDLVAAGFVSSLARPGGNITGINLLSPELDGKRQEILSEVVPGKRRIAALGDATTPVKHLQILRDAGRSRGVEVEVFRVTKPEEIATAINAAEASGVQGYGAFLQAARDSPRAQLCRQTIETLR